MAEDKVGSVFGRFEENTLVRVSGHIEFYYSIGSLVETFGAPERLTPLDGERCSSCEEWELPVPIDAFKRDSTRVAFLYPTQGLWFSVSASDGGCICPEMRVMEFCYYAPITMQEALADDYLVDMCEPSLAGLSEKDLVEWHGFGGGY